MKKTKIVVPALAVLLLSTAASVSGTVAWFSMSTSVTVTGMQVTTKVSSNLLIADTNAEDNYSDQITQSRTGIIEPSSSTDGANFWWTTNGKNDGDASTDEYTKYDEDTALGTNDTLAPAKTNYDDAFNTAYSSGYSTDSTPDTPDDDDGLGNGLAAFAYIDYSFFLKGSASVASQQIALTKCNILYAGQPVTSSYAWRVGVFVADSQANTQTADSDAISAGVKSILGFEQSKNQNQRNRAPPPAWSPAACTAAAEGNAVAGTTYYEKHEEDAPQAVNSASALANVTNAGEEAILHEFSQLNTVKYFKVVVRLWLEGEDVSCTSSTFASLTSSWTLDLGFELGDGTNKAVPVEKISSSLGA